MRKFGPGLVVTAAFIGPGTITTASVAGANFGFALVWALVFSVVTTLILQEMSARLGLVTRRGLAEALRHSLSSPWLRWPVMLLVVTAIGFGNAAYQTGNILGAAVGAATLTGMNQALLAALVATVATILLASGVYRLIEGVLIVLVVVMSAVFIVAMMMVPPDFAAVVAGLVPASMPVGATLSVMALIGTTVVPYNLFLHANAVQQRWDESVDIKVALSEARSDLGLSVVIGGLITLAIMSTAATAFFGTGTEVTGATMAMQLEPVLGDWAAIFVSSGLMAAGLTSAITAPLAAAYAVCGAFGARTDMKGLTFRLVWLTVMLFGTGFAIAETQPITAILIAQAANGILLPLIAIGLVWVMNTALLGKYRNSLVSNTLGTLVILVALSLGGWRLLGLAFGQ
jgi:NRAMP (natural resistance-associated macrophage protein)-like metal ion transporter